MKSLFFLVLALFSSGFAFEKLDATYCVHYGSDTAPTQVVEYFSATCEKCVELFVQQFKKNELKDSIKWTFHPYPADLLTLQLMVCLKELDEGEKQILLETTLESLYEQKGRGGEEILKIGMEALGKKPLELGNLDVLEQTKAWTAAYDFLVQSDVPRIVPLVEINSELSLDLPNQSLFNKLRTL